MSQLIASSTGRAARAAAAGRRRSREAGQSLVEYALAVALIAIASLAAIQALGGGISALFTRILGHIAGVS